MIPNANEIEESLLKLQDRRDKLMDSAREITRSAGRAITMMHYGDMAKAKGMLADMSKSINAMKKLEEGLEYYSLQCHQEYVEAASLYCIMKEQRLPSFKELKESELAYILGVLDVVGELKREAVESLRKDEIAKARLYYGFMVEIYDSTMPMRFANSIVPEFRKKQDVARIQIEGMSIELLRFRK